jgi:hypothetical protein
MCDPLFKLVLVSLVTELFWRSIMKLSSSSMSMVESQTRFAIHAVRADQQKRRNKTLVLAKCPKRYYRNVAERPLDFRILYESRTAPPS